MKTSSQNCDQQKKKKASKIDLEVIKGNLSLILASVDFFILNKAIHKNCQDGVNAIVDKWKIAEPYKKWSVTV